MGVVGDLHANLEAWRAIAPHLETVDRLICLGDFVGYYCQVNEVIDLVRELDPVCVLGNHDFYLLSGCPADAPPAVRFGIEYADRVLTTANRAWLASLPLTWGGRLGGRRVLLAHGSPWRPLDDYVYEDSPLVRELLEFDFDVVALAQTHRLLVKAERRPCLVNPGSVGQPRDRIASASILTIDLQTLSVEVVRCPFDSGKVVELALAEGAGPWITKHLM